MDENTEKKRIQWHPAFCSAMKLELKENKDSLSFQDEYTLNNQPLKMDLLIIKILEDVQIKNDIGRIFRRFNVLEYKSPGEEMDDDVYLKVVSYSLLLKIYKNESGDMSIDDITITLVREGKPLGLFKWLRKRGFKVKKVKDGIYYAEKEYCIPTQILVTKDLDPVEHEWLKALTRDAEIADIKQLINSIKSLENKHERQMADSVLQVTIEANKRKYEHIMEDEIMCEALRELFAPEVEILEKKVEQADARAEQEREKAEQEREKAEQEREKAEQERKRAEQLQKEVDELRAQLRKNGE